MKTLTELKKVRIFAARGKRKRSESATTAGDAFLLDDGASHHNQRAKAVSLNSEGSSSLITANGTCQADDIDWPKAYDNQFQRFRSAYQDPSLQHGKRARVEKRAQSPSRKASRLKTETAQFSAKYGIFFPEKRDM